MHNVRHNVRHSVRHNVWHNVRHSCCRLLNIVDKLQFQSYVEHIRKMLLIQSVTVTTEYRTPYKFR